MLTRKGAAWRKGAPTAAQIARAVRLGVDEPGMTKGEVADAISVAQASGRLDAMPCVWMVTERGYW